MSDQSRPAGAMQKHSPTDASAPSHERASYVRAAARPCAPREFTRLACAASLALFLGVGCGLWLFASLASASSSRLAGARALPAAHTTGGATAVAPPPTATEVANVDRDGAPSSAVEAAPPPNKVMTPKTRVLGASRTAAASEEREEKRGADAASQTKAVRGAGGAGPCAIYTSAGSLSLRGGGAASLVLGGPVTVTTPDWADIAIFSEGRTGGAARAWTKYAVRSVSGRAGSYALRVASPCGAQTIPVRVTP